MSGFASLFSARRGVGSKKNSAYKIRMSSWDIKVLLLQVLHPAPEEHRSFYCRSQTRQMAPLQAQPSDLNLCLTASQTPGFHPTSTSQSPSMPIWHYSRDIQAVFNATTKATNTDTAMPAVLQVDCNNPASRDLCASQENEIAMGGSSLYSGFPPLDVMVWTYFSTAFFMAFFCGIIYILERHRRHERPLKS